MADKHLYLDLGDIGSDEGVVDGSRPVDRSCRSAPADLAPSSSRSHNSSIPYPSPRAVRVPYALETFAYTLVITPAALCFRPFSM